MYFEKQKSPLLITHTYTPHILQIVLIFFQSEYPDFGIQCLKIIKKKGQKTLFF